ncbi:MULTISPECIES: DUF481 domain-containing protein [unclassified Corallococcus]|uniref:DUF481 domain-containing protein n=1 Tax=unclassified Corallococcus TaxID=2685029 RepID=UPI001A8EF3EC|nr:MULTISPECIES: DUF481 domain-containing protein [unclassified Corallococcus]MBN9682818.1 DUF481 domain-containing protein [Corallococcus sp. NCSPR001]WAS85643.1 DUF481 domain-containing protein [Corallococcus sp. NCRR]
MLPVALLLASSLQSQTPPAPRPAAPPPPSAVRAPAPPAPPALPEDAPAAERAAAAAERAALAAERAAEASARLAEAIEKLAEVTARGPIAPPPAPVPEAAAATAPAKPSTWDVSVGLSLISLTGNASTLTVSGLASALRKTEKWIYSVKAYGAYGRSRPPEVEGEVESLSQVVALNAGVELRGDRRFTQEISGYLLAGADTDHIKSIEARPYGEAGAGILWFDTKKDTKTGTNEAILRTDFAFRYARELRFQYYPTRVDLADVDLGGPRFGAMFRYGLSKDITFQEDAEILVSVISDSRVLFSSQTQVMASLTDALALGVGFLVKSDSAPPPGKVSTDTALSFNLTVAL